MSRMRARLLLAVAVALIAATAASCNPPTKGPKVDLGGTPHQTQGILQSVSAMEARFGRSADTVRLFKLWGQTWPSEYGTLDAQGKRLFISVRAKRSNGQKVQWADIASASPGDPIHNEILTMANSLGSYSGEVYFTFHHEPELIESIPNGSDSQFIAAWRNVVEIMRGQSLPHVKHVYISTEYGWEVPQSDRRYGPKWYPGDAWVDGIGTDAYNWYDCRPGQVNQWKSLENKLAPWLAFAGNRPGKFLVLPEFGTVEDSAQPGRKAQWLTDAFELFTRPEYATKFASINYFDRPQPGEHSGCNWRSDSSASSLAAFRAGAALPTYNGGGGNPGGGLTAPTSCSVTNLGGGQVRVDWSGATGATAYIVERNGHWAGRPNAPAASFVDTGIPGNRSHSWQVLSVGTNEARSPRTPCGSLSL